MNRKPDSTNPADVGDGVPLRRCNPRAKRSPPGFLPAIRVKEGEDPLGEFQIPAQTTVDGGHSRSSQESATVGYRSLAHHQQATLGLRY